MLDESLKRLRTDHLDLWQLHDLRTQSDLKEIFGKGGALEALVQARSEGRVRYLGLTGHHDPQILLDAMKRFQFDTVLAAFEMPPTFIARHLLRLVLPEAVRQNMAVIGMKVCAQGALLDELTMEESVGYTLSLPGVSHVIIGCKTEAEVDDNARIAREFKPMDDSMMRALELRTSKKQADFTYYKK